MKSIKYPELNDKEWLNEQYWKLGKSTKEIAKTVGAKCPNSVRQFLNKFNIPIRSVSDGLTFNRKTCFNLDQSVLEGCLLGDGFFKIYNKKSETSYPAFYKRNIYLDHLLYVGKNFYANVEERISPENRVLNGKEFRCYLFRGLSEKELLPYYRRWYPENNNYKKIIPKDIKIDEKVLLHWFLDDGSSYWYRKESKTKQVIITFSSECFIKSDQDFLCDRVNEKFGLSMKTSKCNSGTGWRIRLPQSKTQYFFEIIGPALVKNLSYKWK